MAKPVVILQQLPSVCARGCTESQCALARTVPLFAACTTSVLLPLLLSSLLLRVLLGIVVLEQFTRSHTHSVTAPPRTEDE